VRRLQQPKLTLHPDARIQPRIFTNRANSGQSAARISLTPLIAKDRRCTRSITEACFVRQCSRSSQGGGEWDGFPKNLNHCPKWLSGSS
jgi:hypothetical protein